MHSTLNISRKCAAEVLASVVLELFPGTILVDGGSTEIGFYYDFILNKTIDDNFIPIIEEHMRKLIKDDIAFKCLDMMRENASSFFKHHGQAIRSDAALEAHENVISIIKIGNFHNYCIGPFLEFSSEIGAIKLLKISSLIQYIPSLSEIKTTRIEGTAFPEPQSLKKFLKKIESSKARDHILLGKEMDLFSFHADISKGFGFWSSKGEILRSTLIEWWKRKIHKNYLPVQNPSMVKTSFLKSKGFFEDPNNKDLKLPTFKIEGNEYTWSPTSSFCQSVSFASKPRHATDLPLRFVEDIQKIDGCKTNSLHGMLRSREYFGLTSHIFCTAEQLDKELISSLQFIKENIKIFDFEYHWYLIPRGRKFAGSKADWEKNSKILTKGMNDCGLEYTIDENAHSFNGPQVELRFKDALGREWKGPYIRIDLAYVENFGLQYLETEGRKIAPIMLKKSLFGSIERFIAILIERHAGLLPLWLAPEQVRVIPIGEKNIAAAESVIQKIEAQQIRVNIDRRGDKLGTKIHSAEIERIPYMIIIGEKEEKGDVITVRTCQNQKMETGIQLDSFLERIREELEILTL